MTAERIAAVVFGLIWGVLAARIFALGVTDLSEIVWCSAMGVLGMSGVLWVSRKFYRESWWSLVLWSPISFSLICGACSAVTMFTMGAIRGEPITTLPGLAVMGFAFGLFLLFVAATYSWKLVFLAYFGSLGTHLVLRYLVRRGEAKARRSLANDELLPSV